jgi:hypothetical protein
VETPRKFITAKLSIRNPGSSSVLITDEDPGLRIESFAVINLRGVSTNKTIIFFPHANIQRTYVSIYLYFKFHATICGNLQAIKFRAKTEHYGPKGELGKVILDNINNNIRSAINVNQRKYLLDPEHRRKTQS